MKLYNLASAGFFIAKNPGGKMALSLLAANNAQTVLAAGISSTATSLTVNAGTGTLFPSPVAGTSFFKLTIIDAATGSLTEIVHVTARAGDVFTIQRGQEGTVPRAWSANDIAANMMTAGTLSYILGNFQPLNPTLTALAALVGAANKLPYFTGTDTAAQTDLTSVGRDIIGKNTIADILTYLGLSGFADKSANTKQIFADALSCKFGLEVFSPDGKRSAALYALDSGVSIANGTHSITIPDKAGTLALISDLANFADKSATEKQIFADAIQCKYGIAVADASGAVKTGLYSTNGKSYLASKAGQSVEIPDKNGVMALVDDVSDSAVGVGQTWKDVTSQRALNVVYTNSASKALTVLLTGSGYSSNGEKFLSASINGGPNIAFLGSGANNTSTIDSGLILIPAGATYKITSPTAFTINQWSELS